MIKYPKITDISLVIDTISKKPISKVPLRYRYQYIDIGDTSTIFSIYRPTSTAHHVDMQQHQQQNLHRETPQTVCIHLLQAHNLTGRPPTAPYVQDAHTQ